MDTKSTARRTDGQGSVFRVKNTKIVVVPVAMVNNNSYVVHSVFANK